MAQMMDPLEAKKRQVEALIEEIDGSRGASAKDIQTLLESKDRLIGGGAHHKKRVVTLGQLKGDLQKWLDKH